MFNLIFREFHNRVAFRWPANTIFRHENECTMTKISIIPIQFFFGFHLYAIVKEQSKLITNQDAYKHGHASYHDDKGNKLASKDYKSIHKS